MKELIEYIEQMESESFAGWNDAAVAGYLTACRSIKERALQLSSHPERVNVKCQLNCKCNYRDSFRFCNFIGKCIKK